MGGMQHNLLPVLLYTAPPEKHMVHLMSYIRQRSVSVQAQSTYFDTFFAIRIQDAGPTVSICALWTHEHKNLISRCIL